MEPTAAPDFGAFLHYLNQGGNVALYFLAYIGWQFHRRLDRIEKKLFPGD